jgi:hypothetical protein
MIVIRVELWSAITGKKTLLTRVNIVNDGTGDSNYGRYLVESTRRGSESGTLRRGVVEKHLRKSTPVLTLLRKALQAMGY